MPGAQAIPRVDRHLTPTAGQQHGALACLRAARRHTGPVRPGLAADQPVLARLRATCAVHQPGLPRRAEVDGSGPPPAGQRSVLLSAGRREVPVYARDRLRPGHALSGPCLVESSGSTYLIPAGMAGRVDHFGTAILAPGA